MTAAIERQFDPKVDFRQVPQDLLNSNESTKRFHKWKAAAVVRGCIPLSRLLPGPQAELPGIFMYHRVVPVGRELRHNPPSWNVTPDRFRAQLGGLLKRGYVAWPLSRLIEASVHGLKIPKNIFVVTFDDGYANNLTHAVPILTELKVPATFFLATGYLNSTEPFPFDDWSLKGKDSVHADTWRALTIDECHQMLAHDVVEFGSHTHTHEDFRNRNKAFQENLRLSLRTLEDEFGITAATLSLPYGILKRGFAGPEYFETANAEGASCCLTTEEELVVPGSKTFGWGRFIAEQHDTASTLAVKLDGWRDAARDQWRRVRDK